MSKRAFLIGALAGTFFCAAARGDTWNGSLSYVPPSSADDSITAGGKKWPAYNFALSWTVTNQDSAAPADMPWRYTYRLAHDGNQSAFSHIIIEASEAFSAADLLRPVVTSIDGCETSLSLPYEIATHRTTSGNPGMPSDLTGIKFEIPWETTDMEWSFFSSRRPVWGDFYAKGGSNPTDYAFNYNFTGGVAQGFLPFDIDPTDPAANGSVGYHILRPDTEKGGTAIPLPSTLAMAGILFAGLVVHRVRRQRAHS